MLVTLETTSIVEGLKLNQSEILKMTELKNESIRLPIPAFHFEITRLFLWSGLWTFQL